MDRTELNAILLTSTRRSLLEARLDEAKARFREGTVIYHNGGRFKIDPSMAVGWDIKSPDGRQLMVDATGLPVEIDDYAGFLEKCRLQYTSALRRFHLDVVAARQEYPEDLFEACEE